ncbi:unnamed protein product, partial [Mesorhabditis spiculigera]
MLLVLAHGRLAKCDSRPRNGPDGKLVTGVSLDTSLFYDITCKPSKGFCLRVSNCTVAGDEKGSVPYTIIDANGCTLEESLFGHVQYRTDFQAGIANPYPIRFRGASSAVIFYCQTTLEPKQGTKCEHFTCK